MPQQLTELTLIFRRERPGCRWDDVAILECEQVAPVVPSDEQQRAAAAWGDVLGAYPAPPVTVKAESCPEDDLISGLSYRFYGRWSEHERHGRQFIAKTYVRCQPHGRAGVLRYLTTTCAGCGVGRATAEKLWDRFQGDAVRVLRESPEVAVAAVGMHHFTADKASEAAAVLVEEQRLEAVSIDMIDLLGGRGFPRDTAKKCVGEWGNRAAALVRRSPYLLMRFRGCGFARTDQLYLDLGGNPAAVKRQALCAWYAVARDTEGHTWFRPDQVENGLRARISGAGVDPLGAMRLAKRARILAVRQDNRDEPWIAERRKADNEAAIAEHVCEIIRAPVQWPEVDGLDVSEHQREKLSQALQSSVAILGGSPGTGKTYAAARLISRIIDLVGHEMVAVCAPTGKAAVRITDALASYGIAKTATTIHRLLGIASRTAGEGWGFAHDESNPLQVKYVVLDEGSMPDTDIFAALVRAMPVGAHLLVVGDINQLPPVSHGAPLRDMIASGAVPYGELTDIKRQAIPGAIVEACAAIRDGRPFRFSPELDPEAGENLVLERCASNAASLEAIVKTLHRLPRVGIDPVWAAQVLVTVNAKSELSRKEVNKRLQGELNPDGARAAGCPFRVGDKIIRTKKNTLMPCADGADFNENRDAVDGKVLVCNGEMGRIVQVESKRAWARFDGPKRAIVIPFGKSDNEDNDAADGDDGGNSTGCDFDLGFAITTHKSQGSEWPVVLYGLDDSGGAMRLGSRELIYTALSRGKMFVKCFGKESTARAMCVRCVLQKRKTFLREMLIEGAAKQ